MFTMPDELATQYELIAFRVSCIEKTTIGNRLYFFSCQHIGPWEMWIQFQVNDLQANFIKGWFIFCEIGDWKWNNVVNYPHLNQNYDISE